jgi:hypothetical protein
MPNALAHRPRCRIEGNAAELTWETNADLEVVAISSALCRRAGIRDLYRRLHLSDLWTQDGPFGFTVMTHRWALDGENVTFQARIGGDPLGFELEPLHDADGAICGVRGRACPLQ